MSGLQILEGEPFDQFLSQVEGFGFRYCSLGFLDPTRSTVHGFFSDQSWQDRYEGLHLLDYDPLIQAAAVVHHAPILWEAIPRVSKKAAHVMQMRKNIAHVTTGLTLSIPFQGVIAVLALGQNGTTRDCLERVSCYHATLISYVRGLRSCLV